VRNYVLFKCAVTNWTDGGGNPRYTISMEGYRPDGYFDSTLTIQDAVAQQIGAILTNDPAASIGETQGVSVYHLLDKELLNFSAGWGFSVQDAVDALYVGNPQFWPPFSLQQPWGDAFAIEISPRDTWSHGH
jgi:hypothetical protein